MNARCRWLVWLVLGWMVSPVWALSLSGAYALAQLNDAQYLAALHTFDAALEKLPQARAGLLPSVGLTANRNRQNAEASFADAPFVQRWVEGNNWTVQLTQPLFRWASWATYQQADAQVRQAEAQLAVAEQDVLLRVVQVYLDIVVAMENVLVTTGQVGAMKAQLTLAERHFAEGMGVVTDVHEARAKWQSARAQEVSVRYELESKRAELGRIVNRTVEIPVLRLEGDMPALAGDELGKWLEAVPQGPAVRAQAAAVEVARREVEKNRVGHLPTLDLTANRAYAYSSGSFTSPADMSTESTSNQVGVQLSMPLFSGGGVLSKVREAAAQAMKARDDYLGAERLAQTQVRQSFAAVLSGLAQISALDAALESARSAVTGNKLGFQVGTRINTEVLNAEQQLYATLRDRVKARADTLMQHVRLKGVLGMLQADDLVRIEAMLVREDKAESEGKTETNNKAVSGNKAESGKESATEW